MTLGVTQGRGTPELEGGSLLARPRRNGAQIRRQSRAAPRPHSLFRKCRNSRRRHPAGAPESHRFPSSLYILHSQRVRS
jgi:hypothetical protein